jgi:F-type H+-transporting ATPase subunit b
MRRLSVLLLILGVAVMAPAVYSQEKEEAKAHEAESHEAEEGGLSAWKWANFVVLAAGIGYLIGKNAGPMFSARSRQIRKDIVEAEAAREEAEARAAEVDRRLANLEAEIAALRGEASREAEAETRRLEQHTAAEIGKIQAHSEQEIAAAAKAARMELRRYSAELAIELAERKIRDRMTPEAQDTLVRSFVRDLQ